MRGQVLQYDDAVGAGLISGDDGVRYEFRRAELQQLRPLSAGMRVDFVGSGGVATQIFVLDAQSAPAASEPESSGEDLGLWAYFSKAMSLSFNGEGRARRKEYWSFVLFQTIFLILAIIVVAIIAGATSASDYTYDSLNPVGGVAVLGFVLLMLVFVPASITVTIRRLHDIGLTGWFYLLVFLPYLGGFVLFIMSLIPSERQNNKHGLYPKPLS